MFISSKILWLVESDYLFCKNSVPFPYSKIILMLDSYCGPV